MRNAMLYTSTVIIICLVLLARVRLWNENIWYRIYMHQIHRNKFKPHKKPFAQVGPVMNSVLHRHAIDVCNVCCTLRPSRLNDIYKEGLNSSSAGGAMYWHHLQEISDGLVFEKIKLLQNFALTFAQDSCGEKLYPFKFSMWNAFILKYVGTKGSFGWHYDSEDEEDVRVLICIERTPTCGAVEFYDENGVVQRIDLKRGQAYILRGSQTYHRVTHNRQETDERTMLGFHFSRRADKTTRNLCYFGTLTHWKLSRIVNVLLQQDKY